MWIHMDLGMHPLLYNNFQGPLSWQNLLRQCAFPLATSFHVHLSLAVGPGPPQLAAAPQVRDLLVQLQGGGQHPTYILETEQESGAVPYGK